MADGLIISVDEDTVTQAMSALSNALGVESLSFWLDTTVDPYLKAKIAARFDSEGDSASGRWAELSEYTVASRIAQGYPGESPILVRTGEMEKYLTATPSVITDTGTAITMDLPGAPADAKLAARVAVHQKGSRRNNTPARPMLALDETDASTVLDSLSRHLTEVLAGELF